MKRYNITVNGNTYDVIVEEADASEVSAPVAAPVAAPAPAPVARAVAPAPTQEAHRVTVYVPEVQPKEQKRVKVCVKNLKKADKTLLAATAIFCVGLGAMIQRALTGDK